MLLQIGILGDYNPKLRNHQATDDALRHAAEVMRWEVAINWLPTEALAGGALHDLLGPQDAIFGAPGCPFRSMEGVLAGIEYARCSDVPYLGTCGGFQYALIEYARHALGLADANTEENQEHSEHRIITPVACPVPDRAPGASKLSGLRQAVIKPGTRLATIYGTAALQEEYFCNFEVNPAYVSDFEKAGMTFSAYGDGGEVRALELPSHPFFLATLFQPQINTAEGKPHPVIIAFLEAAASHRARSGSLLTHSAV